MKECWDDCEDCEDEEEEHENNDDDCVPYHLRYNDE